MKKKVFSFLITLCFAFSISNATTITETKNVELQINYEEDYSKCTDIVNTLMNALIEAGAYDDNLEQALEDWKGLLKFCDIIDSL